MSEQKKKKRRNPTGRFLHVLILVVAVLVIFEGRMIVNIITRHGVAEQISQQLDELFAGIKAEPSETEKSTEPKTDVVKNAAEDTVAGLTLDSGNTTNTKASSSASGYVETGIDHTNKQVVQNRPLPSMIRTLLMPLSWEIPVWRASATSPVSPQEIFLPAWA